MFFAMGRCPLLRRDRAPWNARPPWPLWWYCGGKTASASGIVGCTPIPTYPYGKSLKTPYIVGMGYNPQESLENTYHGYTLRGTPNRPLSVGEGSMNLRSNFPTTTIFQGVLNGWRFGSAKKKHHPFRFKQHPAWKMLVGDFTVQNSWHTDAER